MIGLAGIGTVSVGGYKPLFLALMPLKPWTKMKKHVAALSGAKDYGRQVAEKERLEKGLFLLALGRAGLVGCGALLLIVLFLLLLHILLGHCHRVPI
jgi:hypothetical protein